MHGWKDLDGEERRRGDYTHGSGWMDDMNMGWMDNMEMDKGEVDGKNFGGRVEGMDKEGMDRDGKVDKGIKGWGGNGGKEKRTYKME
ncbi:hypothetical protein JTB14_038079 [Gonioctena quinquepunctata]|nr:hypothetical protein JTB14_038079 [Gonioctena quinquepunctata]